MGSGFLYFLKGLTSSILFNTPVEWEGCRFESGRALRASTCEDTSDFSIWVPRRLDMWSDAGCTGCQSDPAAFLDTNHCIASLQSCKIPLAKAVGLLASRPGSARCRVGMGTTTRPLAGSRRL